MALRRIMSASRAALSNQVAASTSAGKTSSRRALNDPCRLFKARVDIRIQICFHPAQRQKQRIAGCTGQLLINCRIQCVANVSQFFPRRQGQPCFSPPVHCSVPDA
ncbi:Uncharacterised protein [Escherichia coli]|nr:Uncharacterised protein [Escherichia coli]